MAKKPGSGKRITAVIRTAGAERVARFRENQQRKAAGLAPLSAEEWRQLHAPPPGDPMDSVFQPDDQPAGAGDNEAAAAVAAGDVKKKRKKGDTDTPRRREAGWLRKGLQTGAGLTPGAIRDISRAILEHDALPYLQELVADIGAKDGDRLRAVDMLAKISVGYMTPDLGNAEDAPELPAPIFETTTGELPGGEGITSAAEDDLARESDGMALYSASEETGAPAVAPHMGAA